MVPPAPPPLVTLTLWRVPASGVLPAVARMALDRRHLRHTPGLRFAKLLGTGDGRTFTLRDADPLRWGLLAAWDDVAAAEAFETGPTVRAWSRLGCERLTVRMEPLACRGSWSGREPFGRPAPSRAVGPVASLTRARLRLRRAARFWSAVPPVSGDLHRVDGLRLAVGIGEAPVGFQGTFSLWDGAESLSEFAYRRAPHRDVVARTPAEGWYREELFARFRVLAVEGTFAGRTP